MESKLKKLYAHLAPGGPIASGELATLGISADLAVHYVRSGWLTRLARGVFMRPGGTLELYASLRFLERQVEGFHVGGRSALDWYGVRQYVAQTETLTLYGWENARLPEWFTTRFPAEYHRKRLFEEKPAKMLSVTAFEKRPNAPLVSAPERGLLEMLSEVGVRQPLQEAKELMESAYTLRAEALGKLLQACTSIKTVRLCLQLGKELNLPWRIKLDGLTLPTGSSRPWVSRTENGLLVLQP